MSMTLLSAAMGAMLAPSTSTRHDREAGRGRVGTKSRESAQQKRSKRKSQKKARRASRKG